MRTLAVTTLTLLILAACNSGKLAIGGNSTSDTNQPERDGGGCPEFFEPPLDPGFCNGNYEPARDENGCQVGYQCVDAGTGDTSNQQGCPPASTESPACNGANVVVSKYDPATLCATGNTCGQVLTEANEAQAVYVSEANTVLEVQLPANVAAGGDWTPEALVTTTLGAGTKRVDSAKGTQVFTYDGVPTANTHPTVTLKFNYAEPGQSPKTFSFYLFGNGT